MSNDLRFNNTSTDSYSRYLDDTFGGSVPVSLNGVTGLEDQNSYLRFGLDIGASRAYFYMPKNTFQRQINLTDTISAVIGTHTLKFGLDYRRLSNEVAYPQYHIRASFTSLASLMANRSDSIAVYKGSGFPIRPVYTNLSLFAQDEWRVTPRLNLSLGLRWEVNPAPGDAGGNPPFTVNSTDLASVQAAPRGTPLWRTSYRNFAPRFGLAYQLRRAQGWETILRAGVGLFYDLGMAEASSGYDGLGASTLVDFVGSAFPLTRQQLDSIPQPSAAAPYNNTVFGFDPALQLPRTRQWNVSLEQAFSGKQTFSGSYLGSAGRNLLMRRAYYPGRLGNQSFTTNGQLLLTLNGAQSDYHALQLQFRRQLSSGFQMMASYTWSHAIDDASSNFTINKLLRASADFDIRHNAQVALTYQIPGQYSNRVLAGILRDWSVDGKFSARSGAPVDILGSTVIDPATGAQISYQPNLVSEQPLYVDEANAPGGRRINFSAFAPAPVGVQGNAGRNLARGFSSVQTDVSIRREFPLGERFRLQVRGEAFNLFNNPAFGAIYNQLSLGQGRFGYAYNMQGTQLGGLNQLYQVGGPRSIQLAMKLQF